LRSYAKKSSVMVSLLDFCST